MRGPGTERDRAGEARLGVRTSVRGAPWAGLGSSVHGVRGADVPEIRAVSSPLFGGVAEATRRSRGAVAPGQITKGTEKSDEELDSER